MIRLVAAFCLCLVPLGVLAQVAPALPPAVAGNQTSAPVAGLAETLRIGDVIGVMRDEGLEYGTTLEAEMFPGRGGARWAELVSEIYDAGAMRERFEAVLASEIGGDPATVAASEAFFGTPSGQRILTLEIGARRALMDKGAEEAARVETEAMIADADPRMDRLRAFAEANDLVERNVSAALNANLAFLQGLATGDLGGGMTEDQMLSDVWSQEGAIRAETEAWLFPFLSLAYGPLEDGDLDAYLAFSREPAGQRLNGALFAAFDVVFGDISRRLGGAAALMMKGEDI